LIIKTCAFENGHSGDTAKMKTIKLLKLAGAAVVVMSVAAGCASTQNQNQQEPKKPEPAPEVKKGPSAGEKACAAAEAARKKAKSVGGEWRDTGKIIKKGLAALKAGDEAKAIKLCEQARRQGELGYAQALAQKALLSQKAETYTVETGDSLWVISGKDRVYGNPYQWPLLYKANHDIINDADLIYPGQDLTIDRGASSSDINAAINHAKTRGAWAIGVVEESDKAYLAQ
jgi:nucleoid-associated protein YgaU